MSRPEADEIRAALAAAPAGAGRVAAAARALGVATRTLQRWIDADAALADGIDLAPAGRPVVPWRLYRAPGQTTWLVATDGTGDGSLWVVQIDPQGWARRTRYRGHVTALRAATHDHEARILAATAGWPGV